MADEAEPRVGAAEGGRDAEDGGVGAGEGEVEGLDGGEGGFAELAAAEEDEALGGGVEDAGLEGIGMEVEGGGGPLGDGEAGGRGEGWGGGGGGRAGAEEGDPMAERNRVLHGNDQAAPGSLKSSTRCVFSGGCGRRAREFVSSSF